MQSQIALPLEAAWLWSNSDLVASVEVYGALLCSGGLNGRF